MDIEIKDFGLMACLAYCITSPFAFWYVELFICKFVKYKYVEFLDVISLVFAQPFFSNWLSIYFLFLSLIFVGWIRKRT